MRHGRGNCEVAGVLRLWSKLPRPRVSRARMGVLEDVLGPRGYSVDGSRRRRGCDVRTGRGGAAAATRIFRRRVAATPRLQRGYSEGRYLGRPETDEYHNMGLSVLGASLFPSHLEEALLVLEAGLALKQRHWSHDEEAILNAQSNVAGCLTGLKRYDEALRLQREVYARRVARDGISYKETIGSGNNLAASLRFFQLWDEAKFLLRDQLLPAARRSLGFDHHLTLMLARNVAVVLVDNPERTCGDLCEAANIIRDVAQRRRRVFGPAHPETLRAEAGLSLSRASIAGA